MIMKKISYALSLVYNIDLNFELESEDLKLRVAERMAKFLALLPEKFNNENHVDLRIDF